MLTITIKFVRLFFNHSLFKKKSKWEGSAVCQKSFLLLDIAKSSLITSSLARVKYQQYQLFLFRYVTSVATFLPAQQWTSFSFHSQGFTLKPCLRTVDKNKRLMYTKQCRADCRPPSVQQRGGQHWDINFSLHPHTSFEGSVVPKYTYSTANFSALVFIPQGFSRTLSLPIVPSSNNNKKKRASLSVTGRFATENEFHS